MRTRPAAIALVFAVVALGSRAAASDNVAQAQALFEEGKKLVAAGRVDDGCALLDESQRLSPAGGTVLHLAACREAQGRLATAHELFTAALAEARKAARKDREDIALARLAEIEPKLSRLRIVVPPASRAASIAISRDDADVGPAGWEVATPVDPGEHRVRARAPGRVPWSTVVHADKPGTIEVSVPPLAPVAERARPRPQPPPESGLSGREIGAIAALGVGAIGLAAGTYFYVDSVGKKHDADAACGGPAPEPCPPEGLILADEAKASGNLATFAFAIGLAAVAAGAVLWFVLRPTTASASARPASVALRF